jgi:hypothetical protein
MRHRIAIQTWMAFFCFGDEDMDGIVIKEAGIQDADALGALEYRTFDITGREYLHDKTWWRYATCRLKWKELESQWGQRQKPVAHHFMMD